MSEVKENLNAKDLEFYSNKEQTRKCSIVISDKTYFVYFTFVITHDTFQLKIDISMENKRIIDRDIHNLKLSIKNLIISDWEQCVWLEDQQSEWFAEDLYKDLHAVENSLRRLINTVLFYNLGGAWWEKYMPTHLKNKYHTRNARYKDRAPSFKNVHTNLLSVDTDDLVSILEFKTYKIKEENVFNSYKNYNPFEENPSEKECDNIKKIVSSFEYTINNLMNDGKSIEEHQKSLANLIKEQIEVDLDFWNDFFSPWFSCSLREFKGKWTNFNNDRNHVAHNKLIDNKMYQKFKKSMGDLFEIISEAEVNFERHFEAEGSNYLEELKHLEEENKYQKKLEDKKLIEEEAGVEILDQEQIINKLQEHISTTFKIIIDEIYFRSDIDTIYNTPLLTEYEIFFEVNHNVLSSSIAAHVEPNIDSSEGATSDVYILVYVDENLVESFEFNYTNGEVEYNEEHTSYMLKTYNNINITEKEDIKIFILELIDEEMPEVSEDELASVPCGSCNNYAVNMSIENEYGVGTCLYCGHINKLGNCLRCDEILDQGEDGLCDACQVYIDKQ
ncbi:hypothetical protein [Salibacterium salarium]